MGSDLGDEPPLLGKHKQAQHASHAQPERFGHMAAGSFVDDQAIGMNLQGEADGFALACSERGAQDVSRDWLSERSFADPCRQHETRRDFAGHRWRNVDFSEKNLEQP